MRMPSFTAVHIHFQSRTASYNQFTVALVTPSMEVQDSELEARTEMISNLE
jgi:hypothetical protein